MNRFTVLADWQLRDRDIYSMRIWMPARAREIARVPWLDALSLVYAYDGRVFWLSGRPFAMPEIDAVFSDPENRWMSDFLAADATGIAPRTLCRVLPRLRLIALYCDITGRAACADASPGADPSRPAPTLSRLHP